MKSWISINALYKENSHLFDGLHVPQGVDKDLTVNNILLETMELEAAIPDPDVLQIAIGYWAAKELPVWEHLYETTQYEYNPIHNYDRTEEETWERDYNNSYDTTNGGTDTTNAYTAGFNDSGTTAATPTAKQVVDYGGTSGVEEVRDENESRDLHVSGNIGVMSTQQMIEQEREVAKFNIMAYIVEEFRQRFCLLVY